MQETTHAMDDLCAITQVSKLLRGTGGGHYAMGMHALEM